MTYDFLSIYPAKLMEYGLAITYLLLFVPMWRYVQGGRRQSAEQAVRGRRDAERWPAVAVAAPWPSLGWFQVPAGVALHPGHTWARVEADGTVAVGVDDFAQRLVAPTRIELPRAGALVAQGEAAVALGDGHRSVPLVSPVNGTVVAVNRALADAPDLLQDAYGTGWLFKVKAPRLEADQRQLLHAQSARHFLDGEAEALAMRASPEVGQVLQDGGVPVQGLARALAGDQGWEALAREFFHTEKGDAMTAKLNRALLLTTAAALLGTGLALAYDLPRLPGPLALKRGEGSPGQVTFRHDSHVDAARPTCLACHPKQFSLLGGTTRETRPAITHDRMTAGRDCGACHGKEAFGLDDCTMCHAE